MNHNPLRILLVVGGITYKPYFKTDLESNMSLLSKLSKEYVFIKEIDTNAIRDKYVIPAINHLAFTDIFKLFLNPFKRHAIRKLIETEVKKYQTLGYEVDIAGHSLGSIEIADSKINVSHVLFMGSPLGMRIPFSTYCKHSLAPFPWNRPQMKCKSFINLYSHNDIVGTYPITEDKRCRFGRFLNVDIRLNNNHDLVNYLDFVRDNFNDVLKGAV